MQVTRLTVQNFRGIKAGTFDFDGHTLFMGGNNVGKSTLCEALDLTLGADRLARVAPIDEYDFYNGCYLDREGNLIELQSEVILTGLTPTIERECGQHLERWNPAERRMLDVGDADDVDNDGNEWCLRLLTVGRYDEENDEFEAHTHYAKDYDRENERDSEVPRRVRRAFNFLYLRTLRTGNRALSLERGSLLDVIVRTQRLHTGVWEGVRTRLEELDPPIVDGLPNLKPVLDSIETRLGEYIPIERGVGSTSLFVSQLTREHLRKTLSFFLCLAPDQEPVPFQEVGTGTLNTLVLALLSFVADLKEEGVIFAMEEPEIALPPHTQRRIASYLLTKTRQSFVTSHSPYVIECFDPSRLRILRRDAEGKVTATPVELGARMKAKTYRRQLRRALAEAMLGRGVIVAEGVTEEASLHAAAELLEASGDVFPLDLAGVTIVSADGDGNAAELGRFFSSLDVPVMAFLDKKTRAQAEKEALEAAGFELIVETAYDGAEDLLVAEVPLDRQWGFLEVLRDEHRADSIGIPRERPSDERVRELAKAALKAGKGAGWAGELVASCVVEELPPSLTDFLDKVYTRFPKPTKTAPVVSELVEVEPAADVAAEAAEAMPADEADAAPTAPVDSES